MVAADACRYKPITKRFLLKEGWTAVLEYKLKPDPMDTPISVP